MNYLAANKGVSIGISRIAPRDGQLNPCPPPEGLSVADYIKNISTAHKYLNLRSQFFA
jgi:hypothetical protein